MKFKLNKMKYAIIETWNGEGYSSENLASIKEFDNDNDAREHIALLTNEQIASCSDDETPIINSEDSAITYEIGDDQGSFAFIRNADKLYGVVILTNVNEVVAIYNKKDWSAKLNIAVQQCDNDELDELDLSESNIFIGAYEGDYDYQFIKF